MKGEIEELLLCSKFIKQKGYWLSRLSQDMVKTGILPDCSSGQYPQKPGENQAVAIQIGDPLYGKLMKFSKHSHLSLYIILLTALKTLIHRYTGNHDVTVLSPVYEPGVTGETINRTVFIRDSIPPGISFIDLLLRVRQSVLEAYENQDYPSEKLLEILFPVEEADSPSDIACVLKNIHQDRVGEGEQPGNRLVFSFKEEEKQVKGLIFYNPSVYRRFFLERLYHHLSGILEEAIDQIGIKIRELGFLSGSEKRQLVYDFNRTSRPYPTDMAIHGYFEKQVEKKPDKIAVVNKHLPGLKAHGTSITYRELNEKANRWARLLIKRGVTAHSIVGLMMRPSVKIIIGIFAVLKAKGTFLPLDADTPGERVNMILEDTQAPVLLTENRTVERQDSPGRRYARDLVMGDQSEEEVKRTSGENLDNPGHPGDFVYTVYTSGSTGKPKGVLISNRNLLNYVHWFSEAAGITEADKTALASSYAFDLGYTTIFPCLLQGGELHIEPQGIYLSTRWFLDEILGCGITYLKLTPSLLHAFIQAPGFSTGIAAAAGKLRLLVLGGEPINVEDIGRVYAINSRIRVMNHYGPTEATIGCVARYIEPQGLEQYKTAPTIGRPIFNTQAFILDGHARLLPVGAAGELCITGHGLACGYLNQPEMTAEKFINSPFGRGKRLYRTGDTARWQPDGNIQFLGRSDHQVKIKGYRIEPGEIEKQLLRYQGIKEAVVVVKENEIADRYLCAYVVPGISATGTNAHRWPEILKEYLLSCLPVYMIPRYIIPLDALPLTGNGKIDRKSLPGPGVGFREEYAAPGNELEERLAGKWAEMLQIEKDMISIDANFFQLGGNSLKATMFLAGINDEYKVNINLLEMYKSPTIREIASLIAAANWVNTQKNSESPGMEEIIL